MSIESEPTDLASPAAAKSPESRQWLKQVRAGVKAKIFGDTPIPDDPVRIGRYVVIKRIGVGGMGLIYAAYDDTLDRKVAVKLLRPERGGSGSTGQARLLREAQAIARLSHPCVVSVYEVGTHEDQVFIAMEYVDGVTLKVWQRQTSWREILVAYIKAGRGLVAAHAAGIVHRDFKADNVLVRGDGAVRVLDFGLARTEFEQPDADVQRVASSSLSDASMPLTHTGTVMGTPAYMAPEQHLGQKTDARTDQFSFCVSLHEALYGYRPFAGDTLPELRENVLTGTIEPEPRYTEIPAPIRRALLQGLAADPNHRFASLEQLLTQLEPPEIRKARWKWAAVAAGLLTVGAAATVWWDAAETAQMRQEGERLRAQFEQTRIVNAEAELRKLRQRTVSERWDDLVLTYAEETAATEPTLAIAALKHLTPTNEGWLEAARTIAADAARRGPIFRERDDLGTVLDLQFDTAGERLLVHGPKSVHVWSFNGGGVVTYPAPEEVTLNAVTFVPDGTVRGVGVDGKLYRVGPEPDDAPIEVAEVPLRAIAAAGERIAVGDAEGTVHLVLDDGTIERSLRRHIGPVNTLAFHPSNPNTLASGGEDTNVWVSFLERKKNWTLEHYAVSERVMWSHDGDVLLSFSADGELAGWDDEGRPLRLEGYPEQAADMHVDVEGAVRLYHAQGHVAVSFDEAAPLRFDQHGTAVHAIAASPDGRWVAAAKGEAIQLWRTGQDASGRRPNGEIPIETGGGLISAITHLGDGVLLTVTRTGTFTRWADDGGHTEVADIELVVEAVELAPDGRHLGVEDENGALHVLDLDNPKGYTSLGRVREHLPGPFAWAPDSSAMAKLGCAQLPSCLVAVYPADGGVPRALGDVASQGRSLRFSADGRWLATDHDSGLWLWDLHAGEGRRMELGPPMRRQQRMAYAFVDDAQALRIATASFAHEEAKPAIVVWQTGVTQKRVHELFSEAELEQLVSSDDGGALLMETADARALMWFLDEDHFSLLPDDVLDDELEVTRLRVAPDRSKALLDLDGGRETVLVDIATGQRRTLPPLIDPVAWGRGDTVVDVIHARRLRKWVDPAPTDPKAFLAWLEEVTAIDVDSGTLR